MDVENNFRAAVDDTRRWAAIIGHDFQRLIFNQELVEDKKWFPARS